MNNVIWILSTAPDADIRNPAQAVLLAEKLCLLSSQPNPDILDTIAAAYAAAGQFAKATETAQKAMDLANTTGQKEKAGEISRRLQCYKIKKPWYDPSLQTK